jgi:hypothetical protein
MLIISRPLYGPRSLALICNKANSSVTEALEDSKETNANWKSWADQKSVFKSQFCFQPKLRRLNTSSIVLLLLLLLLFYHEAPSTTGPACPELSGPSSFSLSSLSASHHFLPLNSLPHLSACLDFSSSQQYIFRQQIIYGFYNHYAGRGAPCWVRTELEVGDSFPKLEPRTPRPKNLRPSANSFYPRNIELKDNTVIVVLGASGDLAKKKTVCFFYFDLAAQLSPFSQNSLLCGDALLITLTVPRLVWPCESIPPSVS